MKPAVSPLLDEAFGDALGAETLRNARMLNRIRLGVLSAFLLLHLVLGAALGQPAWRAALGGIALYWIAALGIFLGSRKSGRLARLSGAVVGFLDAPMVFLIQAGSLGSATDARAAGTFTTAVFLFLIMLV